MNSARRWMAENKGKHICACGCGGVIVIKIHHHTRGAPKYINGHGSKVQNAMTGMFGDKNPHWNGGRRVSKGGYVLVLDNTRRRSNGLPAYCPEHKQIMEAHLGRKLLRHEDVHHIDGNKTNNVIDNLLLLGKSEHAALHMRQLKARLGHKRFIKTRHNMRRGRPYKHLLSQRDLIS